MGHRIETREQGSECRRRGFSLRGLLGPDPARWSRGLFGMRTLRALRCSTQSPSAPAVPRRSAVAGWTVLLTANRNARWACRAGRSFKENNYGKRTETQPAAVEGTQNGEDEARGVGLGRAIFHASAASPPVTRNDQLMSRLREIGYGPGDLDMRVQAAEAAIQD